MNLIQLKRLDNLVTATKEADADTFDMTRYVYDGNQPGTACGTPACLLGNYAARTDLQRFIKVELTSYPRDATYRSEYADLKYVRNGCLASYMAAPVQKHFGLSQSEAENLFADDGCNDAQTDKAKALRYVRKFVAAKKREYAKSKGFCSWKAFQAARQGA